MPDIVRDVAARWRDTDLLTYGSAIAFQVLFALIPVALFAFGLVGLLGLEDLYRDHVVPELKSTMSPAAFSVVDDTVHKVLGGKQLFWVTAGAVLAVWEMSGAVRAVMQVFDRIYGCERERSLRDRYLISLLLALGTGILMLGAVAATQLLPAIAGWPLAIALMVAVIAVFVRYAPADHQPVHLVGVGTGLVVAAWTATSVAFGLYATQVADYGSIFGSLATVFVLFEYLYLSVCAFLTGAVLDALQR